MCSSDLLGLVLFGVLAPSPFKGRSQHILEIPNRSHQGLQPSSSQGAFSEAFADDCSISRFTPGRRARTGRQRIRHKAPCA